MQRFQLIFLSLSLILLSFLSACSSETTPEKNFIGTWVQDAPFSITDKGLRTTTSDTILRLKKNGETHLTRKLDIFGQGLPEKGVLVSVELRGSWELIDGQLRQTPDKVLIIPRTTDQDTQNWAEKLQAQAEDSSPSVKTIIAADKTQLILQDLATGTTDVYRRK